MDEYLTKEDDNYYSIIIGHTDWDLVHPNFIIPRCLVKDKEGKYVYVGTFT